MSQGRTIQAMRKRVLQVREQQTHLGSGSTCYAYDANNGSVGVPTNKLHLREACEQLLADNIFSLSERGETHTYVFPTELATGEVDTPFQGDAPRMARKKKTTSKRTTNGKSNATTAAPIEVQAIEFSDNGKFCPGHDARLAGYLKRIARGQGTKGMVRVALSKKVLDSPSAQSAHMQSLIKDAKKGAAALVNA